MVSKEAMQHPKVALQYSQQSTAPSVVKVLIMELSFRSTVPVVFKQLARSSFIELRTTADPITAITASDLTRTTGISPDDIAANVIC